MYPKPTNQLVLVTFFPRYPKSILFLILQAPVSAWHLMAPTAPTSPTLSHHMLCTQQPEGHFKHCRIQMELKLPLHWKLWNSCISRSATLFSLCFHLKSPTGINKLWYLLTTEYYSVIKRNELSSQDKTWRKFKCIFLSERSNLKRAACSMIPTLWHSGKGKTTELEKGPVVARGSG